MGELDYLNRDNYEVRDFITWEDVAIITIKRIITIFGTILIWYTLAHEEIVTPRSMFLRANIGGIIFLMNLYDVRISEDYLMTTITFYHEMLIISILITSTLRVIYQSVFYKFSRMPWKTKKRKISRFLKLKFD